MRPKKNGVKVQYQARYQPESMARRVAGRLMPEQIIMKVDPQLSASFKFGLCFVVFLIIYHSTGTHFHQECSILIG